MEVSDLGDEIKFASEQKFLDVPLVDNMQLNNTVHLNLTFLCLFTQWQGLVLKKGILVS